MFDLFLGDSKSNLFEAKELLLGILGKAKSHKKSVTHLFTFSVKITNTAIFPLRGKKESHFPYRSRSEGGFSTVTIQDDVVTKAGVVGSDGQGWRFTDELLSRILNFAGSSTN